MRSDGDCQVTFSTCSRSLEQYCPSSSVRASSSAHSEEGLDKAWWRRRGEWQKSRCPADYTKRHLFHCFVTVLCRPQYTTRCLHTRRSLRRSTKNCSPPFCLPSWDSTAANSGGPPPLWRGLEEGAEEPLPVAAQPGKRLLLASHTAQLHEDHCTALEDPPTPSSTWSVSGGDASAVKKDSFSCVRSEEEKQNSR